MTRSQFVRLVEQALSDIPQAFRDAMQNVALIVEDEPSPALLEELEMEADTTLLGFYHGIPLPMRGASYGNTLPDRISIYQMPIEEACQGEEEIRGCIAETLIHEIGHYFGMSEEEIELIERRFWGHGS